MLIWFYHVFDNRFCRSSLPSDITVVVDDVDFHLHKVFSDSLHLVGKIFYMAWLSCLGMRIFFLDIFPDIFLILSVPIGIEGVLT